MLKLILIVFFLQVSFALDYGEKITVKATYHDYFPDTPENTVACQLPMKVIDGVVRVTAANQLAGYDKSYGCGNCLKVTNKAAGGKSTTLMIVDEKGAEGLDISRSAFGAIDNDAKEGNAAGQMQVEVENVACNELVGKLKYRFKAGSNQWWFVISIVDHNLPVKGVALSMKESGPFFDCKRSGSINNYFDCNNIKQSLGGKFGEQMWIKVTSATRQSIVDHLTKITSEDKPLDSPLGKQFTAGGEPTTKTTSKTTKETTTKSTETPETTKTTKDSETTKTTETPETTKTSKTPETTKTSKTPETTKTSKTTKTTETSKTTTKSKPEPTEHPCGESFECPSDGYHPDPCDCHKFYQCHHGTAYSKSCGATLVWDSAITNCNWKHSAGSYVKDHCE